ncbi:unnamed protein product, partial [Ectocarpus sp. 12 AP-2014]
MLSDERVVDILPDTPGPGLAELPEYAALFDAPLPRIARSIPMPDDPLSPFPARGFAGASNAWAAAPDRAAAGATLLANDPHLGFTAPSIWYLARLELQSGGVIGATIPGAPAIVIGRSERLGWALTASYGDDQDVFIEKLNPANREEVQTPDGWKKMRARTSLINVKDADPVNVTLRWTDNGPVLPGAHYNLAAITPPGHVASLRWTALSDQNTSLSGLMGLMRAGTVEEAISAGEAIVAPTQTLTVADRERIAMQVVGHLPQRAFRHETKGRMPSPAWRAENLWEGIFPYSTNPSVI